jgi:hypothetical protein
MAVYLLIGVILLMAPFAGVGVSHILIDLINRLKFNEVSAGITVRKRDELDTELLLREVIQCLRLPHIRTTRTTTGSIERKRNNSDRRQLDK